MTLNEILKILLDNEELMKKHRYTRAEVDQLSMKEEHSHSYIRFMQNAVQSMNHEDPTTRIAVNRLLREFD